jgi:hypothetical protein
LTEKNASAYSVPPSVKNYSCQILKLFYSR